LTIDNGGGCQRLEKGWQRQDAPLFIKEQEGVLKEKALRGVKERGKVGMLFKKVDSGGN